MSIDFSKIDYAPFLEETLKELVQFPVKGIAIQAIATDGTAYTNYHNLTVADKMVIAGCIQQDAMLDTMRINGLISDEEEE